MKIAIPSNDKVTINKRTGQSHGFMVYEIINNKIVNSEYRVNTQPDHDEEIVHSHKEIIELLKDVNLLLVAAVGKHMKKDLEDSNLKWQLVKETSLNQIIDNFLNK